jgi:hypothetical protein
MDQAAVDALVYWAGAFFLGGFTVGVIVKLLLGTTDWEGVRKMYQKVALGVLGLSVMASSAMAQVFPVDASTTTTITSVKSDIVAWGVVFIGVALTIFAYKRVKSLVH